MLQLDYVAENSFPYPRLVKESMQGIPHWKGKNNIVSMRISFIKYLQNSLVCFNVFIWKELLFTKFFGTVVSFLIILFSYCRQVAFFDLLVVTLSPSLWKYRKCLAMVRKKIILLLIPQVIILKYILSSMIKSHLSLVLECKSI